ncbi:MAG: hypothetical protein ACTTK5_04110 [Candidatus Fimenecus sp.]
MNFKIQIDDLRSDFERTKLQIEKRRQMIKDKHGTERLTLDREITVLKAMAAEITSRLFELVKRQEFEQRKRCE